MNILSLFVLIPVVMLLAFIPCRNAKQIRTVGVIGAFAQLALALVLLFEYLNLGTPLATGEWMYYDSTIWYEPLNIAYTIGVDGISVLMLLLTAVIVLTGTFASWNMSRDFFLWLTLLSIGVYGFFISLDLFTMFFFYEIALIPMYLLIGIWGSGRKEYSAMKLTLMLMGGSAFLFVGILGIHYFSPMVEMANGTMAHTFNLVEIMKGGGITPSAQMWIFPLTFVGFGVLGAMFPFHTWSPDGHAAAPTAVSMLHAGVLMKLGGYGCFRIAIRLMPEAADELSWIFLILTGISVLYGALGAISQTDLKFINAYSSVSHCGLVLFAILMLNQTATTGAVMQMLSHGLMTALFFALIGMIYGRTHTRDIREMGGLMKVMPFLCVAYVIAGMASLGLPGLSGFVAEMTIFVGSWEHTDMFHRVFTIVAISSIVVTAVYILKVVGKILYGPVQDKHHLELTDAVWYEKIAVVGLIICVAGMGMFPGWISNMISECLTYLP
ncbi:NuoM family protein [Dysgonomonas sp. 25]|uniref:complex I subunit 4 family protein n=1 Tax=Dysgonomonas sp. 25 TaxID=2302933 RepID=UPI0013D17309|nr:NADH-quinone oxidoreductase subunit M [Dysgonomonas sp. 25]NDV70205.1 NADH-quinone oxidoreductase subunit M [Dysgonomonas sp. 25]